MRFSIRKGWKRIRLRILLFLLSRVSRFSIPELMDATQAGLQVPPDVLIQKSEETYDQETKIVDLAYHYWIALEHDPVVRDLFARFYKMHRELGQAILEGQCDHWGKDLTESYRKAFAVLERIITIPAALQARKKEVEEVGFGIPPKELDTQE